MSNVIIILCVWLSAFASLYSDSANSLGLYVMLPIAFVLSIFQQGLGKTNVYLKILVALILWICFACLWAEYIEDAFNQLKQLLGTLILAVIFTTAAKKEDNIPYLYVGYIVLMISALMYADREILNEIDTDIERLNDEKLNANTLAYYLFYVTFAIYELGRMSKLRFLKITWDILFILLIPLTFFISLLTASRQVLIIQIPLFAILLYLRYVRNKKMFHKIVFLAIAVASIFISLPNIERSYNESILKTRNELDVSDDIRVTLSADAIKVGFDYFPLGVGPGNYVHYSFSGHFSHNNYLELFATVGIVGVVIYLSMIWIFLKRQWKRYRRFRDQQYLLFFIFGLVYAVDGFFYVFYPHLWLMGAFMLVAAHSETYYDRQVKLLK
ncbi:MAG: O-antigen ligase family protein [Alistipes sp.]|nr:O-antigen ligase family protein [Alistipes sp.]